jgi:hypothetical protein
VETLGFVPSRRVLFAFGIDEELDGKASDLTSQIYSQRIQDDSLSVRAR